MLASRRHAERFESIAKRTQPSLARNRLCFQPEDIRPFHGRGTSGSGGTVMIGCGMSAAQPLDFIARKNGNMP
jgi:hypothetical protein